MPIKPPKNSRRRIPKRPFRLGEIALTHGQAKDAADQFSIALESRKDDPKLYNAMGLSQSMQGKYAVAKESYDEGPAIGPD